MVKKVGFTHWETFLYHGDEVAVSSTSLPYESKKSLNGVFHSDAVKPEKLIFALRLKTSDALKAAWAGIFIDGAGTPSLELSSTETDYELKIGEVDCSGLSSGIHSIELKLKTGAAGGTCYNELFEEYYKLRK